MEAFPFNLRKATVEDIPLIREMSFQIWPATYSEILTPEQMKYMLDLLYSPHSLLDQMAQQHEFIIVQQDKTPVGFASFSLVEPGIYKLHKLYMLPVTQGKGAGKYVINEILSRVKEKGARSLILNVNRHNKAKDFYERMGFAILKEEDVDIGNGYFMNDYIMQKKIEG